MSKKKKKVSKTGSVVSEKLSLWQDRLSVSDTDYASEVAKMDRREELYNGTPVLKKVVEGDDKDLRTPHIWNIIFENIETQVSSNLPAPKVTPRRKKDEKLASIIEHWLRNEMDRLPFERLNDLSERTVPLQGGNGFQVEWDNSAGGYSEVGELNVSCVHPKQFGPQPGVYTNIADMDWFIVKVPTTVGAISRKYGVDVSAEGENEPHLRTVGPGSHAEDGVTQYIGYERNEHGGIDKFSWVNDIELEDLKNYQARRLPVCRNCGREQPLYGQKVHTKSQEPNQLLPQPGQPEGTILSENSAVEETPAEIYNGGACPWCGCEDFDLKEREFEEVYVTIQSPGGVVIPGEHLEPDEDGQLRLVPTKIPFYRPDMFPIVLQKSVSVYGKLLGNSDVDQIESQQNTVNRMEKKIIERLCNAGTKVTLPNKPNYRMTTKDGEIWRVENPADKNMIDVFQFSGNLQYEMTYLNQVYEESRRILGITDSFQGRHDATATSGKAKEFSAAQAAGRLESKRIMKNAAYAQIFELMFKFALAYSDESRWVSYKNHRGETVFEEFNRYDFLEQDENGQWRYNDQFLFSCDTSAPLASNREAMWQETRMNLQTGAFGNPAEISTLILFWEKMEAQHYPGAGDTKKYLEERQAQEKAKENIAGAGGGQIPEGVPGINGML